MSNIRLDLPRRFRGPVAVENSEWLFNQAKSQAGQDLFVAAMTQGQQNGRWLELGCGDPIRSSNTYLLEKRLGWSGISIDLEVMDNDMVTPFEEYLSGFQGRSNRKDATKNLNDSSASNIERFANTPYYKNFIARQITDIDDIPKDLRNWRSARPSTEFYSADALTFDYNRIDEHYDYLQIDIHPSLNNLKLLDLLLPKHKFSVITFEHDAWDYSSDSQMARQKSREYLCDHGYQMIISDATVPPGHGNGIGDEPINFEDWWVDPQIIPKHIYELYQNLNEDGSPKYYYDTLFVIDQ